MTTATAIIIGANSELSKALITQLSTQGVELALITQSPEKLYDFLQTLPTKISVYPLQIDDPQMVITTINAVWHSLGGAHLVIVNTGFNRYDPELPWLIEQDIITVNVQGFSLACNCAFKLFREQGYGQLAAINSIAGLRGGASVAYHASKAFASNYLEGLSMHAQRLKLPITITDIQLGLFDKVAMQQNRLWLSPPNVIASQIIAALKRGKRKVYVTKRWCLVAWLTKLLPEFIYNTRLWRSRK